LKNVRGALFSISKIKNTLFNKERKRKRKERKRKSLRGLVPPPPPIKEKERKTRRKQEFGDSKKIRGIKFETRDFYPYNI